MLKFLLFLGFLIGSPKNEISLTIYRVPSQSKIYQIESNILENVISLYNRKNETKITLDAKELSEFRDVFPTFDADDDKNRAIIGTVSITEERKKKYDFSYSYLPSRVAILSLKSDQITKIKNLRLGYVNGTIQENIAKSLKLSENLKLKSYNNMDQIVAGIIKKEVDIIILENVSAWADPRLKVVQEFINDLSEGYGIVFPKNSELKDKLDPYLKYYLKSQAFYKACRDIYGDEIAQYYKKNLYFKSR